MHQDIDQGKDIRLDVDCYDADGKHFIVEVQVAEQIRSMKGLSSILPSLSRSK